MVLVYDRDFSSIPPNFPSINAFNDAIGNLFHEVNESLKKSDRPEPQAQEIAPGVRMSVELDFGRRKSRKERT